MSVGRCLSFGRCITTFFGVSRQVRDSAQSFLTVHVPLYVSYIYVTAPRGWAALEHHTEMEFSFFYDTVLWRTGRCEAFGGVRDNGFVLDAPPPLPLVAEPQRALREKSSLVIGVSTARQRLLPVGYSG